MLNEVKSALCGRRLGKIVGLLGCWTVLFPAVILAEEKIASTGVDVIMGEYYIWSIALSAIGLVLIGIAGAIAQMYIIRKALDGMARQPEAGGQLQLSMIIGLAFVESLVLYVLFISILLLFANPFVKYFAQ
ncbi:MAG: ATP synthase F0 subunit C [Elusimicrobia bacterium]|nr:ATP synthase F0 subunit C [Elusimicrobiota bacterium]